MALELAKNLTAYCLWRSQRSLLRLADRGTLKVSNCSASLQR